jgi:uncharacterized membrane protein YtjA (UPF0391 family)
MIHPTIAYARGLGMLAPRIVPLPGTAIGRIRQKLRPQPMAVKRDMFRLKPCHGSDPITGPRGPLVGSIEENLLLYYALVFFIIAIVAAVLGFSGLAAGAAGIAKILFVVFLVMAIASFVVNLMRGR